MNSVYKWKGAFIREIIKNTNNSIYNIIYIPISRILMQNEIITVITYKVELLNCDTTALYY